MVMHMYKAWYSEARQLNKGSDKKKIKAGWKSGHVTCQGHMMGFLPFIEF